MSANNEQTDYENMLLWTALSFMKGLSPKALSALAREKELDPASVWLEVCRIQTDAPDKEVKLPSLDKVRKFIETQEKTCRLLTPSQEDYPQRLLDLEIIPTVLYVKGSKKLNFSNGLAVVGSRAANAYGRDIAFDLSRQLSKYGMTVISGLARGIDTCAHRGALEGHGSTVAITGCGIDVCYPSENTRLSLAIAETGAVVSEYPGHSPPMAYKFPHRNRIIAALSTGVLIVQAPYKSGAMITADLAASLGRQVMAVPGQVGQPQSEGPLELLASGASLVRSAQDVLDALGVFYSQLSLDLPKSCALNDTERRILEILSEGDRSTGMIADLADLSSGLIAASLHALELQGLIRRQNNLTWHKIGES
ncbi:DNA-processing protein DprA [bacterium]|nr:DNA-processing protein DprA [bacterium]